MKQEIIEILKRFSAINHGKYELSEDLFEVVAKDIMELPHLAPTECKKPEIDIEKICRKCGVHISEHPRPKDEPTNKVCFWEQDPDYNTPEEVYLQAFSNYIRPLVREKKENNGWIFEEFPFGGGTKKTVIKRIEQLVYNGNTVVCGYMATGIRNYYDYFVIYKKEAK